MRIVEVDKLIDSFTLNFGYSKLELYEWLRRFIYLNSFDLDERRGTWIEKSRINDGFELIWECPFCMEEFLLRGSESNKWRYCPNCKARLES